MCSDQQEVSVKIAWIVDSSSALGDRPPCCIPAEDAAERELAICLITTVLHPAVDVTRCLSFLPWSLRLRSCKPQQNMNADYIDPDVHVPYWALHWLLDAFSMYRLNVDILSEVCFSYWGHVWFLLCLCWCPYLLVIMSSFYKEVTLIDEDHR